MKEKGNSDNPLDKGRLTEVFNSAKEIPFDDSSNLILFSDCHRGDNSWADDFGHNQNLFFHALEYYFSEGFTYIELGDGDELWENKHFEDIREAHSHIFWLLGKFHIEDRFYLIWGNHDKERMTKKIVEKTLYRSFSERKKKEEPLFEDIEVHEGLTLHQKDTNIKIFLVHGHQVDCMNDKLWKISRFCVRHFWKRLQLLGWRDPTSPAKNYKKRVKIEEKMAEWAKIKNVMLIAGHTHRPVFPSSGEPSYFNTGSCVHPRCITGIEIKNGEMALIKWWVKPDSKGALYVAREILEGPRKLESFLEEGKGI